MSFSFACCLPLIFFGQGNTAYFISSKTSSFNFTETQLRNPIVTSIDSGGNLKFLNDAEIDVLESPVDIQIHNNKLYGLCNRGGKHGFGGLFSYNLANGTYSKLIDFDNSSQTSIVSNPISLSINGNDIYITTWGNNYGGILKYNMIDGSLIEIINFRSKDPFSLYEGGLLPIGDLHFSNDKIYGLTMFGGGICVSNQIGYPAYGTLFTLDKQNYSHEIEYVFDCINPLGFYPNGSLFKLSDSELIFPVDRGLITYNLNSKHLEKLQNSPTGQIKGDLFPIGIDYME